jgi:CDGSH-type Zn-finger protein
MSDDSNVNQVKAFVNPKSGSIRITGTVEFVDADGNVTSTMENPKFCGCGLSKEKPFCDGSHKEKNLS